MKVDCARGNKKRTKRERVKTSSVGMFTSQGVNLYLPDHQSKPQEQCDGLRRDGDKEQKCTMYARLLQKQECADSVILEVLMGEPTE